MYAIIAEYNRIQKPLFDTYDALAADLLRRQWAIEKAQEESKYPGANSTEIKSTTNWVRENFPDLRQPLIRTK